MKIIVGLGNPGERYATTRHNAGFLAIDAYLKATEAIHCHSKFSSQIYEMQFGTTKTLFIKPQTFMNNSGQAVRELLDFYKVHPSADLLVIHDEIDLPLGKIRVATDSSSAGHNGVQNIIHELGSQQFERIRIGVESRQNRNELPTDIFLLQPFTKDELVRLYSEILPLVSQKVQEFIKRP